MRLGGTELIVLVFVVLLLFGGTLIPKIVRNATKSIKITKEELDKASEELREEGIGVRNE